MCSKKRLHPKTYLTTINYKSVHSGLKSNKIRRGLGLLKNMNWTVRITLLMLLSVYAAGCVVHPNVLTDEQIGTRIKSDKGEMFNSQ